MIDALRALDVDDLHVLVIDDNSPDGTEEIATAAAADERVHVLHRAQKGRASARPTSPGSTALEMGAERIFEMDWADFPTIRATCRAWRRPLTTQTSCSACAPRAGHPELGAAAPLRLQARRLASTQVLLQLGVRDLTGGFKCYRREVLERIDLGAISSLGYAFQIETTCTG